MMTITMTTTNAAAATTIGTTIAAIIPGARPELPPGAAVGVTVLYDKLMLVPVFPIAIMLLSVWDPTSNVYC